MSNVVEIISSAYGDEVETVANYLALSIALDGVRAEEIKEKLAADVEDELGHARALAQRLKELGGTPPGTLDLRFHQKALQPPGRTTDVRSVVHGVLEAEGEAIRTYRELITAAQEADDPVTEDLAIKLLGDEERHRSLFRGYLKEIEAQGSS